MQNDSFVSSKQGQWARLFVLKILLIKLMNLYIMIP